MSVWERFTSRLLISARLVTRTGMRIGAGNVEAAQPTASNLPVLRGVDGRPYIPGSSLRGVLRSHIERIVRTMEPETGNGQGACIPVVDTALCITRETVDIWRNQARTRTRAGADGDAWFADQIWQQSCRVCRTFGSAWLASRVRIADLHLAEGATGQVELRDGVAIHREKETVENKYDFEIVPRGTAFALQISAENLDSAERGLLWLGLRELEAGSILLGGFKGRGLGQVDMQNPQLRQVDAGDRAALSRYLRNRQMAELPLSTADGWIDALWQEWEGDANARPTV